MHKFHNVYSWSEPEEKLAETQRKYANYFSKGQRVLDIGCGRGVFLKLLRDRGVDPVGIDYDQEMVKVSRGKGFKDVFLSDASTFLGTRRMKFDGIFLSHVIEHIDPNEAEKIIKSAADALKPGGKIIIVTPHPGSLWSVEYFYLDTTHIRPYPLPLLEQLVLDAGLDVEEKGIDQHSIPKPSNFFKRVMSLVRRIVFGVALYNFVYGGGVSYLIASKGKK